MRDKLAAMPEGLAKESYRRLIKEQEDFDIKEKRVTHEGDIAKQTAVEERVARRYQQQQQRWIATNDLATVDKEYAVKTKALEDEIKEDTDLDGNAAFNNARRTALAIAYKNARNAILRGGNEQPETGTRIGRPAAQTGMRTDLTAGSRPEAPKEGETFVGKKGRYTYRNGRWGIETGAAAAPGGVVINGKTYNRILKETATGDLYTEGHRRFQNRSARRTSGQLKY